MAMLRRAPNAEMQAALDGGTLDRLAPKLPPPGNVVWPQSDDLQCVLPYGLPHHRAEAVMKPVLVK